MEIKEIKNFGTESIEFDLDELKSIEELELKTENIERGQISFKLTGKPKDKDLFVKIAKRMAFSASPSDYAMKQKDSISKDLTEPGGECRIIFGACKMFLLNSAEKLKFIIESNGPADEITRSTINQCFTKSIGEENFKKLAPNVHY